MIAHTNASYDKNMFALSKSSKIESIKKSCKGIQKEQEHSALYFATLFIIHHLHGEQGMLKHDIVTYHTIHDFLSTTKPSRP